MRRDPEATRARILEAATAEFAEYGISGARVNRIAAKARANKQLIYAYFGDKDKLFSIVLSNAFRQYREATPFDAFDIPTYVGAFFDALQDSPVLRRLILWERLERHDFVGQVTSFRDQVSAVARAQEAGKLTASMAPTDLLALARGVATAWAIAPRALSIIASEADLKDEVERHRAAAIEAARRLIAVQPSENEA